MFILRDMDLSSGTDRIRQNLSESLIEFHFLCFEFPVFCMRFRLILSLLKNQMSFSKMIDPELEEPLQIINWFWFWSVLLHSVSWFFMFLFFFFSLKMNPRLFFRSDSFWPIRSALSLRDSSADPDRFCSDQTSCFLVCLVLFWFCISVTGPFCSDPFLSSPQPSISPRLLSVSCSRRTPEPSRASRIRALWTRDCAR